MHDPIAGCTDERNVSQRPRPASGQPSEPTFNARVPPEKCVILLSGLRVSHAYTTIAELKSFMLRYCSQWHNWQQMARECRSNGHVSPWCSVQENLRPIPHSPRMPKECVASLCFCMHAALSALKLIIAVFCVKLRSRQRRHRRHCRTSRLSSLQCPCNRWNCCGRLRQP